MKTVWENICQDVGIFANGKVAEDSILELLPCIARTRSYAMKAPKQTARELTEYLDDVVRNP